LHQPCSTARNRNPSSIHPRNKISLVIGLGMGTAVDAAAAAALPAVTVAMVFHQALEGLALGAVLAPARFLPMWKRCVMIVAYALTMPAGIAAGIALAASFDPGSVTAQGVQGALSTFSAGLLLHLSMFQLIGEELTRHDLLVRPRLAAALFAAIAAGAASMAVIALWE
jgi:zinc transporter 1/2/3